MLVVLVKFGKEVYALFTGLVTASSSSGELIIGVLTLVDVALIMNLLIIVMFSGYENFVSRMCDLRDHPDRPDWMGQIGFSDLKIKLIGSMVAISGIELLKTFINISQGDTQIGKSYLGWMVGIHVTFLLSGLAYALMDRLGGKH
jgi:uncharacterized protein (TIGR00645 family)